MKRTRGHSLFFGVLIVIGLGHLPAAGNDLDRFMAQLKAVGAKYEFWSVRQRSESYAVDATLEEARQGKWSERPIEVEYVSAVRIVRGGERFRIDEESIDRQTIFRRSHRSWNGKIARERDWGDGKNSPRQIGEIPWTPHSLVADGVKPVGNYSTLEAMFGLQFGKAAYEGIYERHRDLYDVRSVQQVTEDDIPCWKADVVSSEEPPQTLEFWFSRQHDLLPIRIDTRQGNYRSVRFIDSFQQVGSADNGNRWFPKRIVLIQPRGPGVVVTVSDLSLLQDEQDDTVFSDIDMTSPLMLRSERSQMKTPAAIVGPPILPPAPLGTITSPPKPTKLQKTVRWLRGFPFFAYSIAASVLLITFLLYLWLALRRRRQSQQQELTPWHTVRNSLFVLVMMLTITVVLVFAIEPSSWVFALPLLMILGPLAWSRWRRAERTDEAVPRYRVRTMAGITGAVLTLAVLVGLSMVPTWFRHGVAAAAAGLVGLFWIAAMQCFIRSRRFSIMTILSLATCMAMIMAGYQGATQQIRARQQMIDDLGQGQFDGSSTIEYSETWGRTPEGLLLHRKASDVLGAATFMSVERLKLPHKLFRAENLRRWNLSDVFRIDVRPEILGYRYDVDPLAIAAIPKSCPLGGLYFRDGVVTDAGIKSLARFKNLRDLLLCLNEGPVPNSLAELSSLTSLHLQDAFIDDRSTTRLSRLPRLSHLSFSNLQLHTAAMQASAFPSVSFVDVNRTELTPQLIDWLSSLRPNHLQFFECKFSKDFELANNLVPATNIWFLSTPITEKQLLSFSKSLDLEEIRITGARISGKIADRFNQEEPGVLISWD